MPMMQPMLPPMTAVRKRLASGNPVSAFPCAALVSAHFGKSNDIYYYNIKDQNENTFIVKFLLIERGRRMNAPAL